MTSASKENLDGSSPVRRIYKGDVPYIYDNDTDLVQKVICQNNQRCFRFRGRSETVFSQPEVTPVAVRRQALSNEQARPPTTENYPDNSIVTSRYTMWDFLPKNLFEQFRRVVNFYFLVVVLVHTTIDTPVPPFTAVSPLTFVILVTAIKQGYEDWLRHKNDEHVNNRGVRVIKEGTLHEIKSKDIQVGDIIRLEADEQVPTDLLLLGSSDEFLRCQINTANLDGETNLKLRYCPAGLPNFRTLEELDHLHLIVECEHPNEDLYEFNGSLLIPADKLSAMHWSPPETVVMEDGDSLVRGPPVHKPDSFSDLMTGLVRQGMTDFLSIPLSMDNMALRGTRLKNTDFIYGLVIYTGKDTRLARNSEKSESKFSTVETAVNYYLAFFIAMLVCLVAYSSAMCYMYDYHGESDTPWYRDNHTGPEYKDFMHLLNTIASFIVLFNYIIPISLYVTIELQKFLGSKFFVWDNDMVDDEGKEPLCNTSDLNEELGQIQYLFSDKTGTLTQNVMKFRHCSIGPTRYELNYDDHKLYNLAGEPGGDKKVDIFSSPEVLNFFQALALCHSVQVVPKRRPSFENDMISTKGDDKKALTTSLQNSIPTLGSSDPNLAHLEGMEYQASSPDEKALLDSCQALGIAFFGAKDDRMTLCVNGIIHKFKRLMTLEFDADRKCMSVIVENREGEIWLLTKGAESSVAPKCDDGPRQEILKHVAEYAQMGLRTLVVATRKLTPKELEGFSNDLRNARRQLKNRQLKVREVYMTIESNMTLIGATGVEDQLQEHVPETLKSFALAGIRVWMLTGDKLETGVNVATACGLVTPSTQLHILSQTSDPGEVKLSLLQIQHRLIKSENNCFVVDGESLSWAFKECPDLLREVSMTACRVVCCRMAPLQKAQVVNMVKSSKKKPICCAVGDGANDCAMILAAHIGIGILGKEGRQAARCADFAISKFGFLRKAVLVHGHWYYVRLATLANYFFYKNVVLVLPQFFYANNTKFSPEALFNGQYLMNYNIFFVACPIFCYGLTEQPYSAEVLLKYPELYQDNRNNALMTIKSFIPWILSATWHACVCYYLPVFAWDNFDFINDTTSFGIVVFNAVFMVTNMKMAIETKFISWWYVFSHFYSYGTYFLFTTIYSEIDLRVIGVSAGDFRNTFYTVLSSFNFWLLMLLIVVTATIPDVFLVALKNMYHEVKIQSNHPHIKIRSDGTKKVSR